MQIIDARRAIRSYGLLSRAAASRNAFMFLFTFTALSWAWGIGSLQAAATGPGYIEVSAPEVKTMLEENKANVLINSLSNIEFEGLHIPGSISIPVVEMAKTDRLPADKQTPVIFYCMSDK